MSIHAAARPQPSRTLPRALNFFALLLNATAVIVLVWIIVPAPLYNVWLLSVVASEWSLWFGALALCGAACSLVARAMGGSRRMCAVNVLCGALATALALVPPLSALREANRHHVRLSLSQYVSGAWREANERRANVTDFTTYTFAAVDGNALQLDAYLPPAGISSNGAGLIVVHGGSWNAGGRSDFPQWNRWFAQQGFAVFDIDYRLAPQPNWQTATGDVKCAVVWVKNHAAEFQINPERLALMGRSAGGHLALLAAYTVGDARLLSNCASVENRDDATSNRVDASVRAVVAFYAPTDLLWAYKNPANQLVLDGPLTIRRFLGGSPGEASPVRERFALASPVAHVTAQTPPTLLIHGGRDQLVRRENMTLLAAQLEHAPAPFETISIRYAQHGFDYNFYGWGAQIVKPVILAFLHEHLNLR